MGLLGERASANGPGFDYTTPREDGRQLVAKHCSPTRQEREHSLLYSTEIGIARYLLIKRGNVKKHHVMAKS